MPGVGNRQRFSCFILELTVPSRCYSGGRALFSMPHAHPHLRIGPHLFCPNRGDLRILV